VRKKSFTSSSDAADRSVIDPITGHEYGLVAGKSAAEVTSSATPKGWLSTRRRRSFFTISRSASSRSWFTRVSSVAMRSDSSQIAVSNWLLGSVS
jgi:hypothetical protein